jgi:hypothetical protein
LALSEADDLAVGCGGDAESIVNGRPPVPGTRASRSLEISVTSRSRRTRRLVCDAERPEQELGGWNRVVLKVCIAAPKKSGVHLRNEMEAGPSVNQRLLSRSRMT